MGNAASIADAGRKQGNALYAVNDYAGAVRLYRRTLNAGVEQPHMLHSNMSACYAAAGLMAAALESADAAIAAAPAWPKGHYRRASILEKLELFPEAKLSLRRALASEPQNDTVLRALEQCSSRCPAPPQCGQGAIFAWGRGEFGALGHGNQKDCTLPRMLDDLRGMRIADIACGTGHTLVVSEAGDVFAWGWNSKGQCGLADGVEAVCSPTMLGSLLGRSVRAVACGAAHSLAVTAEGEVLSWGLGGSGQLGHGDWQSSAWPRPIAALHGKRVQGVACGFGHTIVLSGDGQLYAWGWNRDGQLGVGDCENRAAPQLLSIDGALQHVACGGAHSAVVSTKGEMYTFGSGSCGQLGLGEGQHANALRPSLVQSLQSAAVRVALAACGEEFTVAITDSQSVYVCGLGNVGQMGNGREGNADVPILVEAMEGKKAEAASCGAAQVHIVTTDGAVYVWGLAGTDTQQMAAELRRDGPFGAQEEKDLSETLPMPQKNLKSKRVTRLVAGRRHFACLTSPASPLHSRLEVPADWSGKAIVDVPAGKRMKLLLRLFDAMGRQISTGGERVVGRLMWDGGDAELPGSAAEADAAADAARALAEQTPLPPGSTPSQAFTTGVPPRSAAAASACASEAAAKAATATAAAKVVDVDDCFDGTYEITSRPRREGLYELHILLNGEQVLGSPQRMRITASKPAAEQCVLTPVLFEAVVGLQVTFTLTLRDEYANELTSSPGELDLAFQSSRASGAIEALHSSISNLECSMDMLEAPEAIASTMREQQPRAPPKVKHVLRDDGVIKVTIDSESAGSFLLKASIKGIEVQGSPAPFTFLSGPAHAPNCYAHAEPIRTVSAGHACALVVRCFDRYGNNACSSSDVLAGTWTRDHPASAIPPRLPAIRARPPQPPGTAALMFTPNRVMELRLDATLNGSVLPGSPFAVTVIAGDAAAISSSLQGDGLLGAVVRKGGLRRSLTLVTCDVHGNPCTGGGADVSVSLCKNDASPLSRPSSARPSSARPSSARGPATARAARGDGAPADAEQQLASTPAAGSPAVAPIVAGEGAAPAEDGAIDASLPAMGGRLVGVVTDCADGSYKIEYVALPGEWIVEVRLNGKCVPPTPCSVCNVIDPAEEQERKAREEAERKRQQEEAEAAELARQAAEAAEAEARREEERRRIEAAMIETARRDDEKQARLEEAAKRRAAQEQEKRRRIVAALKREEETRRRAEDALAAVQAEKERQLAEALRRKQQFSKRTGGGFVVNFKPVQEEKEATGAIRGAKKGEQAWSDRVAPSGSSRRLDLSEAVHDAP